MHLPRRSTKGGPVDLWRCVGDAGVKLASVATDVLGVSARAMLDGLIGGERDPDVLADIALGRMRPKRDL